ncbi:hypothetical protein BC351_21520 [Paenibacillus ferrarius]|uniref:Uncharacterized protein n=1 Tax=Paenibacillus ferrarius TaxID=1469647 RepID=A0A1V4HML6_9BACL|nr:hypothetical protein BC351_21520 [Paenibacillus ferrarius]
MDIKYTNYHNGLMNNWNVQLRMPMIPAITNTIYSVLFNGFDINFKTPVTSNNTAHAKLMYKIQLLIKIYLQIYYFMI